jgi:hypothetical protein
MYGNGIFFLQIQDQTRLAHSQWLCILNATVNVRTNLYNYFMHIYLHMVYSFVLDDTKIIGGGGEIFFFNFLPWFLPKKKICPEENPSPRPRPSINLVALQNRPKYFFY